MLFHLILVVLYERIVVFRFVVPHKEMHQKNVVYIPQPDGEVGFVKNWPTIIISRSQILLSQMRMHYNVVTSCRVGGTTFGLQIMR